MTDLLISWDSNAIKHHLTFLLTKHILIALASSLQGLCSLKFFQQWIIYCWFDRKWITRKVTLTFAVTLFIGFLPCICFYIKKRTLCIIYIVLHIDELQQYFFVTSLHCDKSAWDQACCAWLSCCLRGFHFQLVSLSMPWRHIGRVEV